VEDGDDDPLGGLARRVALSDHAELIAGLGSWQWTPEPGDLVWSDNLFRIFGFEPGEVVPSVELVLEMVHPDDRSRVEELLSWLTASGHGDRSLEYRIIRADGTVCLLRVTLAVAIIDDDSTSLRRIIGSVQDLTLERRLASQAAAHIAVTQALDEWDAVARGAATLVAGLGEAMEFAFGVFWVPEGRAFMPQAIWHQPSDSLEALAATTRDWRPGAGSACIGRAFVGRRPVFMTHPSSGSPGERGRAIRAAGLQGAMAMPAVSGDETFAVFEFMSLQPIEPTERLVRVLAGIGHEIGHFLSHRSGELKPPVLTAREREVLQLAARAWTAPAIAKEMHLSPATVKRHFERAYAALGVSDRAAAVGEAMRRGLIT
jgi:PAS domain S-box-containing protein